MDPFSRFVAIESWTLYVVGIVIILCRMISRRIAKQSWRGLQVDDYMMMVVAVSFTGVIVCVNETATHGSNYLPGGEAERLTDSARKSAIWGSKMTFALEHFTLTSLWMVKGCLLILYSRLTMGLKQHLIVKLVAVYVVASFCLIQILFCAVWCGPPITMYWDVPVRQSQCATYYKHMITTTVFNISSDIMMICIPVPVLIQAQLPWKRKIVLCGLFSMGVFIILMAVLNRYYNFTMEYTPTFLKWYVAEVATSVYVGNLPVLWPLLKQIFHLGTFFGSGNSREVTNRNNPNQKPPKEINGIQASTSSLGRRPRGKGCDEEDVELYGKQWQETVAAVVDQHQHAESYRRDPPPNKPN